MQVKYPGTMQADFSAHSQLCQADCSSLAVNLREIDFMDQWFVHFALCLPPHIEGYCESS